MVAANFRIIGGRVVFSRESPIEQALSLASQIYCTPTLSTEQRTERQNQTITPVYFEGVMYDSVDHAVLAKRVAGDD